MAIASVSILVYLLVLLAVFVGFLFLERFLARQESKYPGLVLPGIQILGSLILVGPFVYVHRLTGAMNAINADFNARG